jgi:chromosome segregation ATPase
MLDEMDRLYNTEDYEKQIQKQSQAIMDIQSDINKLSLAAESGDMDAQTKINDLREKLDEEREKLVEIQTKRERDLRKQNLQDSIKDYEENTKKQIEILDKEYEDFQSKLDSKLSEENIYLETRKAMMTGHIHAINDDLETVEYKFEDIETAYINFENRFGEGLSLLGNKIKSEFIDNIQLAKKAMLQLQDVTVGSGSIDIEKAKEQIGVLQTLWNTVEDDKKRKEYADEAERLRKKYGLGFEDLRGYTGVYNSNSATSQISNPSSGLSNLVKNIPKFILNPLDNVANKIPQYTTKTSSSNNDVKLSLNFPNIIGEMNQSKAGDVANEVFRRFRLELKKLGVQL